jgi:CubicO group peptidase (beta-lactamase class C family)
VVTLIARHGEIVNLDAYGVLDVSAPVPVPARTDSIFRIASMTKPITGAAMMMLWEEGKWALDDPVAKHIPQFAGLKVRRKDGAPVDQAEPDDHGAADEPFRRLRPRRRIRRRQPARRRPAGHDRHAGGLPLSFQPGTDWRYGPSVDIQGYLVEKLSGQGLDEFFEQRLFAPLGMADTGFWVDASKGDRVSRIHKYDDDGKVRAAGPSNIFNTAKPKFLAGGGGLVSKIEDYWRFAQMILNGGEFEGRRYLKPSTVELMHTNVLEPGVNVTLYSPGCEGPRLRHGLRHRTGPGAAKTSQGVQSFYWGGAFGTWFWIDPINDMIVIGMIQNVAGSQTAAGNPPGARAVGAGGLRGDDRAALAGPMQTVGSAAPAWRSASPASAAAATAGWAWPGARTSTTPPTWCAGPSIWRHLHRHRPRLRHRGGGGAGPQGARDEAVISTKAGLGRARRRDWSAPPTWPATSMRAWQSSQTDHIDVFLLHGVTAPQYEHAPKVILPELQRSRRPARSASSAPASSSAATPATPAAARRSPTIRSTW